MSRSIRVDRLMGRTPPEVTTTIVAAIFVRLLFALEVRGDPFFHILVTDARSYFDLGTRFAAGDFLFGNEPLWFAPLYPTLLGSLFRVFGPEPEVVRFLQHALGIASAGLTADLARRLAPGAGWVAGFLVALSPVALFFEGQLLYTSSAVFLTALFLNRLVVGLGNESRHSAAITGGLLGALGWVRANALLFLPVGAMVWALRRGRRAGLLFLVAGLATLVPILLRNGLVADTWTALGVNGGLIFADGFHAEAKGGRTLARAPDDFGPHGAFHREAERRVGRSLSLAEASSLHRKWTLERMRDNPDWAGRLVLRKVALLVNAQEIDDNLGFETVRDRAWTLAWLPAPWAWVVLPAVVGAGVGLRRRSVGALALVAYTAVYAASLLLFFVTSRYRLPLLVPFAALAGLGAAELVRAAQARRFRVLALSLVGIVVTGVFAFRDTGLRSSEGTRLVAIGAALQDAGFFAPALELTDAAIDLGVRSGAVYQNRALILLSLGRAKDALRSAEVAVDLEPELAAAWNTRGTILARAGRIPEALPFFRRAVELDPGDELARTNLSLAIAELERTGAVPEPSVRAP